METLKAIKKAVLAGKPVEEVAFLHLAAAELRITNLRVLFGRYGKSDVALSGRSNEVFWFDGSGFQRPGIELKNGRDGYPYLTSDMRLDERRLYFSGKCVYTLSQRYQNVVVMMKAAYNAGHNEEAYLTEHIALRFPDSSLAIRAMDAYEASKTPGHKRVPDFENPKTGVIYVRKYCDPKYNKRSGHAVKLVVASAHTRAVQGNCIVDAGASPRHDSNRIQTMVEQLENVDAAIASFEEHELLHLTNGYVFSGIYALPIRELHKPASLGVKDANPEAAKTIEKLENMLNSKDEGVCKQANELVIGIADPIIDCWALAGTEVTENSETKIEFKGVLAAQKLVCFPIDRTALFQSGTWLSPSTVEIRTIMRLLKRTPKNNEQAIAIQAALNIVSIPRTREAGVVDVSDFDALTNTQLLQIDCRHGERWRPAIGDNPLLGLEALARLPKLHTLTIIGAETVDIAPLASSKSLHTLELFKSKATGLAALAETGLRRLVLSESEVDQISRLPLSLQELVVVDAPDTQQDWTALPLGELTSLRELELHVAVGSIEEVKNCSGLQVLDLRECPWVKNLAALEGVLQSGMLKIAALCGTSTHPNELPKGLIDIVTYAIEPELWLMLGAWNNTLTVQGS